MSGLTFPKAGLLGAAIGASAATLVWLIATGLIVIVGIALFALALVWLTHRPRTIVQPPHEKPQRRHPMNFMDRFRGGL